jgi:DNA-binding MarR family transcriptional regulator
MEKAGLVTRHNCPDDARGVIAEITPSGRQTLTDAAPAHVDGVRDHLVDLMTEEEQAVVAALFERVIAHLDLG